jgi:hypothetical protein
VDRKVEHEASGNRPSLSRRNVLKVAGVGAAAVGASQTLPQGAFADTASDVLLSIDVVDYVDRNYVVRVASGAHSLRLRDGIRLETSSGAADIREDRYTGDILVKPHPGEAVSVRATVPAGSAAADRLGLSSAVRSDSVAIGYDASEISDDELHGSLAGGGSCTSISSGGSVGSILDEMARHLSDERLSVLKSAVSGDIHSTLRVRAAVMGNVIPASPSERVIRWRHARYYGLEAVLGLLRFTYDLNRPSALILHGDGPSFFPATGLNSIYCRMEMLELAASALSRDPMVLPSESVTWPPYSTPMNLAQPVEFYDESDPDRLVMTILENEMKLYDYNGVAIRTAGTAVTADGVLHATFEVTNQTEEVLNGRWVLIGDHTDTAFTHTDATITLGPAGGTAATAEIDVTAPVRRSELSQRVSFAVLGLSDPIALGITPITFRYPNV